MNTSNLRFALVLLWILLTCQSHAMIILPEIISDHAVLQQKSNVRLWGWASPGTTVEIKPSWTDNKYMTHSCDNDGYWHMEVPTPEASFEPMSISFDDGHGTMEINDVLIGEVWLCSGQSNMEMPMRGYDVQGIEGASQAIAYSGNYPGIRLLTIPKKVSNSEQHDTEGKWKVSSPVNVSWFSALAYFFAQSLTDILHVPVGVINCSYGGSKLEAWMPGHILDSYPGYDVSAEWNDSTKGDWERLSGMYNAMIKPISRYTIKGFLWNQGESNVGTHDSYPQHQKDMIDAWRKEWGLGALPFYFVELPGWNYGDANNDKAAIFRECQHEAARITDNSGIVCTSDLVYPHEVEDIHACKKKEIGERLAFMAASRTYGIEGIPCSYPTIKSVEYNGSQAILWFNNETGGLSPNHDLPGFEVAGNDRVFYPAKASEDWSKHSVTLTSEQVKDIKAVRYCFKNFAIGKVKDMFGMPLIPFRTDNWDNAISNGD